MSQASVFFRFRLASSRRVSAPMAFPALRPSAVLPALVLAASAFLPGILRAQTPGTEDITFLSALSEATIFTVTLEDNSGVERLTAGGDNAEFSSLDDTGGFASGFTLGSLGNVNRLVYVVVPELLTDTTTLPNSHKLLVGGLFGKLKVNKVITPSQNIARISYNGAVDATFNPGKGSNAIVTAIVPQADGSMVVGGEFTEFNAVSFPRLVKLNVDGSINTAFAPVAFNDNVYALASENDPVTGLANGNILVGGSFSTIGSDNYTKLTRVDQTGTLDASFRPVIDDRVLAILVQPDGKIVIGGQFNTVNGTAVDHLARLNADGSLDATFSSGVRVSPAGTVTPVAVYALHLLPDGRIYVGGNFSTVDGVTRHYLGLIGSDGSLDASFDPGTAITNSVQSLAIQANSNVLVAETVTKKVNNVFPPSLVRLYGEGLSTLSTISVNILKGAAVEGTIAPRQVGLFQLVRSGGDTTVPLTVYFQVSGSAQQGVAYKPLKVTQYSDAVYEVTFPPNVNEVNVKVRPLNNVLPDSPETFTLTLVPSRDVTALYDLALPASGRTFLGTITISNAP